MSRASLTLPLALLAASIQLAAPAFAQTPDIPDEPPAGPGAKQEPEEQPEKAPPPAKKAAPRKESAEPARREPAPAAASVATKPEARKSTARLAPMPSGETGLVRVAAADSVAPKLVRLSFGLDFFSVSSFFATDDSHSRVGGTLAISTSPINYLELWLSTRAQSNSNSLTTPQLLQSQGDLTLGVKGFYPFGMATAGVDLQLGLLSGIGQTSFDLSGTNFTARGLLTMDLQKSNENIPLRAHLNAGVTVDNSHSLLTKSLSNAERFALGISDYSRFGVGIALEVPVKYVTPFLEYTIDFPLGYLATPGVVLSSSALRTEQAAMDDNRICEPTDDSACARPAVQRAIPQRLTPGVRVTAIPDLTLDFAVEIGITPTVATGVVAVPPYNVVLLASYVFDPFNQGGHAGPPIAVPVLVPEITEVAPKPTKGDVSGLVKSKDGTDVGGALISFDRAPPVATAPSGAFKSLEMEAGPVTITVSKDGYETATAKTEVVAGEAAEIEVKLTPSVREGVIRGRVVDEKDKPISKLIVDIKGPTNTSVTTGEDGGFEAKVIAGKYTVDATSPEYLEKGRELEIKGGETMSMDMLLRKRPKQAVAEISGGMIVVKQSVHFVTGEARLAPDAAAVLDSVVDVLVRNKQVKKLRIEGHTDNVGNDAANLQLSKDRATSVMQYLAQQGIDPSRLTAEGFGAGRPIAPNLTRRGREQNRRVEFHIVE